MRLRSVFLALYLGFLVFVILSLFFGSTGVASMEKLNDRKRTIEANLENLDSRKEDLTDILTALRSDPDAVMVEARSLGLYRTGENVVYMAASPQTPIRYDAGSVLLLNPIKRNDETFLRIISLAVCLLAILVSLVSWRIKDANTQGK